MQTIADLPLKENDRLAIQAAVELLLNIHREIDKCGVTIAVIDRQPEHPFQISNP